MATVEEQTLSDKVIVFKKKRRKTYKKEFGFKARITVLKINSIDHPMPQELLEKAVAL